MSPLARTVISYETDPKQNTSIYTPMQCKCSIPLKEDGHGRLAPFALGRGHFLKCFIASVISREHFICYGIKMATMVSKSNEYRLRCLTTGCVCVFVSPHYHACYQRIWIQECRHDALSDVDPVLAPKALFLQNKTNARHLAVRSHSGWIEWQKTRLVSHCFQFLQKDK